MLPQLIVENFTDRNNTEGGLRFDLAGSLSGTAGFDVTETWNESRRRDHRERREIDALWLTARHFSAADPRDAAEAAVTLVEQLFERGRVSTTRECGKAVNPIGKEGIEFTLPDGGCRPAQPCPKAIHSGTRRRRFARNSSENSHGTQPIQNGHG